MLEQFDYVTFVVLCKDDVMCCDVIDLICDGDLT